MTSDQGTPILQALLPGIALAILSGCTSVPPTAAPSPPSAAPATAPPAAAPAPAPAPSVSAPSYRCDHEIGFTAQFGQDAVTVDAPGRGREVLLRDAGGVTPQQTVYSNERLKAEFGLGAGGNEAVLRYADPALVAHCTRQ
jgi:hypothetical protein